MRKALQKPVTAVLPGPARAASSAPVSRGAPGQSDRGPAGVKEKPFTRISGNGTRIEEVAGPGVCDFPSEARGIGAKEHVSDAGRRPSPSWSASSADVADTAPSPAGSSRPNLPDGRLHSSETARKPFPDDRLLDKDDLSSKNRC
jgi:hypothetical protein